MPFSFGFSNNAAQSFNEAIRGKQKMPTVPKDSENEKRDLIKYNYLH